MNGMLEYNPQRMLDYVKMVKKHVKTLAECNEIVKKHNDDKKRLEEMARSILDKVKQSETNSFEQDGYNIEIDHEKGMVLFRPKKITIVKTVRIPKSKYYGKKRNKMINTYHKY